MHQTRKGNQWYVGMKTHIGVDFTEQADPLGGGDAVATSTESRVTSRSGFTPRSKRVWGDSAYSGQKEVLAAAAAEARDWTRKKGHRHRKFSEQERAGNRYKSRVRAKVEPQLGILKFRFGFAKVGYRGLAKNAHRLVTACAFSNPLMAKNGVVA